MKTPHQHSGSLIDRQDSSSIMNFIDVHHGNPQFERVSFYIVINWLSDALMDNLAHFFCDYPSSAYANATHVWQHWKQVTPRDSCPSILYILLQARRVLYTISTYIRNTHTINTDASCLTLTHNVYNDGSLFNVNGCVCLFSSVWIWNVYAVSAYEMYCRWWQYKICCGCKGNCMASVSRCATTWWCGSDIGRMVKILITFAETYTYVSSMYRNWMYCTVCDSVVSMRVITICIGLWIDWQVSAIKPCIVAYIYFKHYGISQLQTDCWLWRVFKLSRE